jgi:acetoin utilization protein AcuB
MSSATIQNFMTVHPHTIGEEQKVPMALKMMREYGVRHLPVLRGGKLVGIISDRDIRIAEKLYASRVEDIPLSDVIQGEPTRVLPTDSIKVVSATMAKDDSGKLVGIFTEVDAFRALATLLS